MGRWISTFSKPELPNRVALIFYIRKIDEGHKRVNLQQRYDEAFPASIRQTIATGRQTSGLLGLLIIIVIVLLLCRSNERLGWRR